MKALTDREMRRRATHGFAFRQQTDEDVEAIGNWVDTGDPTGVPERYVRTYDAMRAHNDNPPPLKVRLPSKSRADLVREIATLREEMEQILALADSIEPQASLLFPYRQEIVNIAKGAIERG
jgi:hypothetical protein